jgi:hypothetical protein
MNNGIPQISISDRVNAAQPSPSQTDTSSVPTTVNSSPGKSAPQPIDTGAMDKAKADVPKSSQQARTGTSDSARKGQVKNAAEVKYKNTEINPEDQAKSPNRAEDISQTPQPKSKGFMESLMDKQMASTMSNNTGGDINSSDPNMPTNTGDPNNVKKAPEGQPQRRDQIQPFQSTAKVKDPGEYPNSINTEGVMKRTQTPNIKMPPNLRMPNIRMKF